MFKKAVFAGLAVVLACWAAAADELPKDVLTAAQIEAKFKGFTIYGLTPSRHLFQVNFKADGMLTGQTHKDADQGKWWVKGNTLCRHWGPNWSHREGKEESCFPVQLDKKCVHFFKPDGEWYRTWTTVAQLDPAQSGSRV